MATSKALKQVFKPIKARRKVMMTGTPILNRPIELWPIVNYLDPDGLGSNFFAFALRYCGATKTEYGWTFDGATNLDELQTELRKSIMIRRLKPDVLTELPAKRKQLIELSANGASAAIAEEMKIQAAYEGEVGRLKAEMMIADALGDAITYHDRLAKLRQARAWHFSEMAIARHKVAVAKIPYIVEHLREAVKQGKVIFFAHHSAVIDAIAQEFGLIAVKVTGSTPSRQRQEAVDRFQDDPSCTLFIGSILAAGNGITLTASAHVVFGEFDWRPGLMTQAEDRAHRIGQIDSVLIQMLVFENSFDARMAQANVEKADVITAALDDIPEADVFAADIEQAQQAIFAAEQMVKQRSAHGGFSEEALAAAKQHAAGIENIAVRSRSDAAKQKVDRDAALLAEAMAMTPEQIEAVHSAVRILASHDSDRAQEKNGVGFNKGDSYLGHALAAMDEIDGKLAVLARGMLRKYHGQIGNALIKAMQAKPVGEAS